MVSRQAETTRGRTLTLFVLAMVGIWAVAASNAKAALQPGCTQSGTTVTCSYPQPGQVASFTVPTGVASLNVYAVGGTGGGSIPPTVPQASNPGNGGPGAIVAGSVSATPGSVLSIQVAGNGDTSGPGAGGGGAGCTGGGGASRMSTSNGPLVVAAGGGGGGCYGTGASGYYGGFSFGGNGGSAGADGAPAGYGNAAGGAAGTSTTGGVGGAGGTGIDNGNPGTAGTAGAGGAGGSGASGAGAGGGGGGGGLYGGGGGGQGAYDGTATTDPGGGGGGGSSLVPPGGSLGTVTVLPRPAPLPSPMVVISYTAPPSAGTPAPGTILPPGSPSSSIPQGAARVKLTGVSQSHARWRRGTKLPQFATIARAHRKPPVGTTFRFSLSGAARVRFAFTQTRPGRRVRGRCVAPTTKNRGKRRCSRTITPRSFSFSAGAGRYAIRFQGRVSRSKKLKPGRYTLIITATNTAGSTSARLTFTILS